MPNNFFKFKQFTVNQNRCAMKVGTDGVLLGAWASVHNATTALDVGTGTGLIALMVAQRNSQLLIDAIEIDKDAAIEANENVMVSPFGKQINVTCMALHNFSRQTHRKYDLIVCNPPFFSRSLQSPNEQRTLARHNDGLLVEDLIAIASGLLSPHGKIALVFPFSDKEMLIGLAQLNCLFVSRLTNVYPTPNSIPKRVLIEYSKDACQMVETDLVIELSRHVYSAEFTQLANSFYLKM